MGVYRRHVSTEDARERYLLVEKRALKLFPAVGEPFDRIEGLALSALRGPPGRAWAG